MDTPGPEADVVSSDDHGDDSSKPHGATHSRRPRSPWRVGTPLMVLLSGALFAISAANSDGTDLRPGRYTDLATLVQSESDSYAELQQTAVDLKTEVDDLTGAVDDRGVQRKQRQGDKLQGPASVEPVRGAGITVLLSDAPTDKLEEALNDPDLDLQRFLVHQQDIQAVVNALWAGGATAVTIQGQRIVSTTGIKCTGSAVQLQGVPYPQPYTIQAVGNPVALTSSVEVDPDVAAYRYDASLPDIGLGFAMQTEADVEAPAYEGLLDITYAKPVR